MKKFLAKVLFFIWVVAVWVFVGYLLNSWCFGATRSLPRYKVAPTNVVERIDGTNCYVRYMYDNLLHTNLVVMRDPFDPPPPAPSESMTNDFVEVENE